MSNTLELVGTPEISKSGIKRKSSRSKEQAGKLVVTGENTVKRSILFYSAAVKDVLLAAGIAYGWEDLSVIDPLNHYAVAGLAVVMTATYLTFKFSKIQ